MSILLAPCNQRDVYTERHITAHAHTHTHTHTATHHVNRKLLTSMMSPHMIIKPDGGTHTDTYAHIKLVQYHMSRKTAVGNDESSHD